MKPSNAFLLLLLAFCIFSFGLKATNIGSAGFNAGVGEANFSVEEFWSLALVIGTAGMIFAVISLRNSIMDREETHYSENTKKSSKGKEKEIVVFERLNAAALFSILLAGIALGVIAHEAVHVLLISHPSTVSVHFGDSNVLLSTCCLEPGESAFEEIAVFVQFAVLILWTFLNRHLWIEEVKSVKS